MNRELQTLEIEHFKEMFSKYSNLSYPDDGLYYIFKTLNGEMVQGNFDFISGLCEEYNDIDLIQRLVQQPVSRSLFIGLLRSSTQSPGKQRSSLLETAKKIIPDLLQGL